MYLVQLLLPIRDNDGRPFERQLFRDVEQRLTDAFRGLTAYSRAPATGLWKNDDGQSRRVVRDDIVVYEVMAEALDEVWWREFRQACERAFAQDIVVIRAQQVTIL